MAEIKIKITAENKQAIEALKQVANAAKQANTSMSNAGGSGSSSFDGASKSAGGLLQRMSNITVVAGGIVYAFKMIKSAMEDLLEPGYKFAKTMESGQLGMAGIIQSMTTLNGQAVPFANAMGISADMMKKLNQDALRTAATTEELVTVFRSILAPGIGAGMTLEQIREITVAGTNAVKSIGLGSTQLVQEVRDLVQGGIQASSSTLATALGITDADITKAKQSTEGLYKYLIDRLKGFEEAATQFPDTLAGKEDMLKEVWTQAGKAFVDKFEQPIKEGLDSVTKLIADVDTKTGQITFNPTLIAAIDEVNAGFQEMKRFAADVAPSLGWVNNEIVPAFKYLYKAIKDVGAVLLDVFRIIAKVGEPFFKFMSQGFKDLLHDIAEATGLLKGLVEWMAKKAGIETKKPDSMADYRRGEDSNTSPKVGYSADAAGLQAKFENAKLEVKKSQEAMKIAEASIKADAKIAQESIKAQLDRLETLKKQDAIAPGDYARQKAELEYKQQQVAVEQAQRILEVVSATRFEDDADKREKANALNEEIRVETAKLETFGKALTEVSGVIGAVAGEGRTWARELGNVNIEGLTGNTRAAIDALGDWFFKQTGRKMTVSSGLRDWGGHVSGTKFDVVDDAVSTMLENNENGIRDRMIKYAESLGLRVLDEYANPSERATAGHLDFNASDFKQTFTAQAKMRLGTILTKTGMDYREAVLALYAQADDVARQLAEFKGDVSTRQKAELAAKYGEIIRKFEQAGMTDFVKMTTNLMESETAKIDFEQVKADISNAALDLQGQQEILIRQVASGIKGVADAVGEYATIQDSVLSEQIGKLRQLIEQAKKRGDRPLMNQATNELKELKKQIAELADKLIGQANARYQHESTMIENNANMTTGQKEEAKKQLDLEHAREMAGIYQKIMVYQKDAGLSEGFAESARKLEEFNQKLKQTPTLMDEVGRAAKQAFESGLENILTEGIFKIHSLGEAVKQLAITVLTEMQKIYAKRITRQIMGAIGIDNNAEGGEIKGQGTGTSDSILSWLSNGEFVIKASSVRKFGAGFFHALNNGFMPKMMMPRFAVGGQVGNSGLEGAQGLVAKVSTGGTTLPLTILNVEDPAKVERFFASPQGGKVILNHMKSNAATIRQVLNIKG